MKTKASIATGVLCLLISAMEDRALVMPAAAEVQPEAMSPLQDAIAGWTRLAQDTTSVTGQFEITRKISIENQTAINTRDTIHFGSVGNVAFTRDEANGKARVRAVNRDYAFMAHQQAANGGYVLDRIQRGEQTGDMRDDTRDAFEPFLFAGFEIAGKRMPDLVQSPHFSLVKIDRNDISGTASIDFEYTPPAASRDTAITSGTIVCNTRENWAIESFSCNTVWGTLNGEAKYSSMSGRTPVFYRTLAAGSSDKSLVEAQYNMIKSGPLNEADAPVFLENYGLDSSIALASVGSDRPYNWRLLASLALIVVVLSGIVALRRRRIAK